MGSAPGTNLNHYCEVPQRTQHNGPGLGSNKDCLIWGPGPNHKVTGCVYLWLWNIPDLRKSNLFKPGLSLAPPAQGFIVLTINLGNVRFFQPWQRKRMATASWVTALHKKEHKNWVMVGCALNIAKNGITPLIQREMEAWYQSLISRPPLQSLPVCTCAIGSPKCVTCVTWETELKRHHKSSRPKICWDNSDRTQWGSPTGAWEIAKIFMPTLGRRRTHVVDADTTDIGGLLNLLEWCPFINPPVRRTVLSSARDQCRNHWAHAPKQELQDVDVNTIFGHLNNLLNDPVFNADIAAQKSSKDLQDLFHHGLVNVRDSEVEALYLLRQSLVSDLTKCRVDLADVTKTVSEAVQKDVSKVKTQGDLNREGIVKLREQLSTQVKEVETGLNEKISKVLNTIEDFNRIIAERHDLQGALQLISQDVDHVRSEVQNVALELTRTKSQVDNLEINLASVKYEVATNKNTISNLQKDVMEVKEEVETLKAKPPERQISDDSDALCTAPSRLTAFTGREAALAWLEQNLDPDQSSENCPGTSCCTKAICGLGGCGKTSLAVEFSWRYMNRFPGGVFWINGESDENVCKSVVENLALLNIPASTSEKVDDTLNRLLATLSKKRRPWLLVVDNVDELEDPTCPTGVKKISKGPWQRNGKAFKHGHILLTTRRSAKDTKTFLKLSFEDSFELQCFSKKEGALFLMQKTGLKEEPLDPDAILLAKELGSLPLALEQAAAYISALPIPCSFKAYLEKYRAVKLRLLKQQPATALSVEAQHRLSVHTTWEMNFEFLKEISPAAATMMRIAAFLESDNIPIDVINPGFPELHQEDLREGARSEIDVDVILKVLSSYSLFSVDQKRRVFAVHKLVQEVVRESLTTAERIEILVAATRVLYFAFKETNKRDIAIALLLSFRTLKNHIEEESKLLKEDSLHGLYNTEILPLCVFVEKLFSDDISLFSRVYAELSEFKLRVLRIVCSDADQPDLLLETMVRTSLLKQSCSSPQIDKEARKLSDNAVKKLNEYEKSGVKVNADIKFDVLERSASCYFLEKQWEEYYKALLKLEELPTSLDKYVQLQLDIARAESFLSPCNPQSPLRRYQNTLKIAREIWPFHDPRILTLLEEISDFLCKAGMVQEAKPYANELWEICKKLPPTSVFYITGMTAAMRVKCHFDPQASENILVDILERNWPDIYRMAASLRQRQVNVEEITVADGTEKVLVVFLSSMLECFFAARQRNFLTTKLNFYRTIAEIKLYIQKSLFGEIHPDMEEAYECLKCVHVIEGNEKEVSRLQELVVKCQQLVPDRNNSAHQTLLFDDSFIRTRWCKHCANVLFRKGNYLGALELYDQALSLSQNDAKLLSNKAATYVKLSQQSSVEDKQTFLEQALQASQDAITADRSWVKGYYWKAVCLAHLGKRGPSLAAAAVAKHLFPLQCAKIPAVVARFGSCDAHVVATVQELLQTAERRDTQNLVIVVKEGRFELPSPLQLPNNTVMVGLGEVQITCPKGGEKKAKTCLNRGQLDAALSLYSEALISCPNNPQILTSRASTYLKSAELKKDIAYEREILELALNDTEAAIRSDPTWLLGYYTKAVSLAELDRKQQALAAAAVFKHLSSGRDVPGVAQRYGGLYFLVIQNSDELCGVSERIKKLEDVNRVLILKEGKYLLERSVKIPQQVVVVGHGKVTVTCKNGAPFRYTEACHVENVEIIADCDNEDNEQQ
ncbi:hypothetical protein ACROYT_G023553 [Oculina patagonica]